MTPTIFGLSGPILTKNEVSFLKGANPAGIILFSRNISTPDQVLGLTSSIRDALGRDLLVLIDQEGGRVQRLTPPHWRQAPPMNMFGKAYEKDQDKAKAALELNCRLLAYDLSTLGINVDCLPVLDIPVRGADQVIGDRAFHNAPEIVTVLGRVACQSLLEGGIFPVIKHIPGHGRALVDSHKKLPVVDTPLEDLVRSDFVPFRGVKTDFAMTAHVAYLAIDPDNPATLSRTIIEDIIRGDLGFEGFLISDDINMKALNGTMRSITQDCLAAGIDLVLHCSGDLEEMDQVMEGVGASKTKPLTRIESLLEETKPQPFDFGAALREFQALEKDLKEVSQ